MNTLTYRFFKNYFSKNIKNTIKVSEDISSNRNFWLLSKNNNTTRIYPHLNKILLSGNLLINSREGEGDFNTNLTSIQNPN